MRQHVQKRCRDFDSYLKLIILRTCLVFFTIRLVSRVFYARTAVGMELAFFDLLLALYLPYSSLSAALTPYLGKTNIQAKNSSDC